MDQVGSSQFFPAMEHPITKVGIVVRDAVGTAKHYSEMFALGPWSFQDQELEVAVLENQTCDGGRCDVRVGMNTLGDKRIELVQPLYGRSTYQAFLDERGEGVHHLGFGPTAGYDGLLASAGAHGLTIEMEAALPGSHRLAQLGPWAELGVFFELTDVAATGLGAWGRYRAPRPGWVSVADKRIGQIGIVTHDSEAMARRYHELFGIGPWYLFDFRPPVGGAHVLHDVAVEPGLDHSIKAAIADHSNLQFEFLQPVIGPSTHLEYLQALGTGTHHLSFDVIEDHDELVAAMQEHGIGIEMAGMGGDAYLYTYLATRERTGTLWEVVKFFPDEDIMAGVYGVYPPEKSTG